MNAVVKTQYGEVRGSEAAGVYTLKGVPYAAPPFGANRFQPPQPVEPWNGVRDALDYGPTVLKPPYFPPFDALLSEPAIAGEDSLNLNIWSPDLGQARLPVMVWIHGGAFANGSGAVPEYDGTNFARDGVVCVTINYRLGIDGFLYLADGNTNRGLLDQLAALTWIQENIAAFGGDPHNVTVFGESAGAMSIGILLSIPRAQGLFRRAILESGAAYHFISSQSAQRIGKYFAERLGIEPTQAALAAIPLDALVQAQVALGADFFNNPNPALWGEVAANQMPFEPVIDGDILPKRPMDAITAGASANVDVLVGTNTDEQRLFMVPNGVVNYITEEALAGSIANFGLPVEATLATYRAELPNATPGDLLCALVTDWFYRIPAIRLAEAQMKNNANAYMYEFAWRSPQLAGTLGACHALEITFVFDNLDTVRRSALTGTDAPQQLADTMHKAWVAFATSGNPGWSRYDLSQRPTMRFDTVSQLVNDPHATERALWEGKR